MKASTVPPPPRLACPRCRRPMGELTLGSHRQAPVQVDHCAPCRLVWFDRFESVHLDASGWVRLLRTLQADATQAPALSAAQAATPRLDCPTCREPLARVFNSTRYGRFAAHECKADHGHLQGHVSLLAERGLLRPLGAAERRALAQESRALHCLNCGGPAHARDDRCRWCDTALMVVDVPRLLHSLRPRDEAAAAAPRVQGRPMTWSCRGCGAALDPGRDAECGACGHLLVIPSLPDLEPVLAAAEAALAPSGAASRAGSPRERAGRSRRRPPAPATVPPALQALMLWGWAPLLGLVALALGVLVSIAQGGLGARPSPLAVLRAQPLGPDLAMAWGWARELRTLARDPRDAPAFERRLMQLHLRQATGILPPPGLTLGHLLDESPELPKGPQRTSVDALSADVEIVLARVMQLEPGAIADPPAEALRSSTERLSLAGPGVWVESERRSHGVWMPTFRNTGPLPLPLHQVDLRSGPPVGDNVSWRCRPFGAEARPAAGAPLSIAAGQPLTLLCRTTYAPAMVPGAWLDFTAGLRTAQPQPLRWDLVDRGSNAAVQAALDAAVAAAPAPVAADLTWPQRWTLWPAGPRAWVVGAGAVLLFAVAGVLIRWLGGRPAFVVGLLAAGPAAWAFGGGLGTASVLTVGGALAAAVLVALGLGLAWGLYEAFVLVPLGGARRARV